MWIISVLPLGPAAPQKEFSYWSSEPIEEGSIAEIPVRGGVSFGLVTHCDSLADKKQEVRGADFSFKKISGGGNRVLTRAFLRAAFAIANQHACSAGAVVDALTPAYIQANAPKLPSVSFEEPRPDTTREEGFAGSRDERAQRIIAIAHETTARSKSTLVIAPTIAEARRLAEALAHSMPDAPLIYIDSAITKKALGVAWRAAIEIEAPVIVVGTMQALSCPRQDLGAVMVERALSRAYRRDERPYLNALVCAEELARACGARLILLSPAPLLRPDSLEQTTPLVLPPVGIIDMRPARDTDLEPPRTQEKKPFSVFSDRARETIAHEIAHGKNVLLLCARRGLATQTVCNDCGELLTCTTCGSALILSERSGARAFHCPHCRSEEGAKTLCRKCGGWRLAPLGIGTERVYHETRSFFPSAHVVVADEKQLRSLKQMAGLTKQFEDGSGAILISTEGALPYLTHVDTTIIVSIDPFLFAPEYSAAERALHMLAEARGLSRAMIIQTRVPEHAVVKTLESGDANLFTQEESAVRERFQYPPRFTLIKITLVGTREAVRAQLDTLLPALAAYKPQTFSGKVAAPVRALRARTGAREHILIRLPHDAYPDTHLLAILRSLPQSSETRVDPLSVLGD